MVASRRLLILTLLCLAAVALFASRTPVTRAADAAGQTGPGSKAFTQDMLFAQTKVWNAELTFTPDQWKAIQPVQGPPTRRPVRTADDWLQGLEGQRNGWAVARGIELNYVHGNLVFEGVPFHDVAVRFKGNGSFGPRAVNAFKTSFKIDLNKYVKGQKLAGVSTLNFHNDLSDPSWTVEPMSYRLYRDAGLPASRTAFVRLHVTVTGEIAHRYAGLYALVENVDTNFLKAHLGTSDGALVKPVTMKPFNDLGDTWAAYNQTFDPKTDLTDAQKARIIAFCKFATHATDAEFAAHVWDYIDLPAFVNYMAVVVWINNWDSILWNGQNYYAFMSDKTGKFVFMPWDQDFSFGNHSYQLNGLAAAGDIYKPWPESVPFLERVMKVPAFRTAYLAKLKEYQGTIFQPARFPALVAELARVIRPALADEPAKPANGKTPAGIDQAKLFDEWTDATGPDGVLPFVVARHAAVAEQLATGKGPPPRPAPARPGQPVPMPPGRAGQPLQVPGRMMVPPPPPAAR
jgi:hypothetical protein